MSQDAQFLAVVSFNGEVKLFKLPPIINPLRDEEQAQTSAQAQAPAKGATASLQVQHQTQTQSQSNLEEKVNLKAEIDNIPTSNIDYNLHLITKLEPKKEVKFKDPFPF